MDFDGDPLGFFDVFTEISVVGGSASTGQQLTAVSLQFFHGGPLGGDLIATVPCETDCTGTSALSFRQQIPASIFTDGFESGDVSAFVAALNAGEVSVAVRVRILPDGPEIAVAGLLLPAVQLVSVAIPGGLSTFGYCGADTDTNDLLQRHSALDTIFLLNPETRKFDAVQRQLPGNLRPNFPIVRGQGMFLRASGPFEMEVQAVQSVREAGRRVTVAQGLNFEEITWTFQAGIDLVALCADATTNTALLGSSDAISRIATFNPSSRNWTLIGTALPEALRTEVAVPTSGAVVVFADAPGSVQLPCQTATVRHSLRTSITADRQVTARR